MRVIKIGGAQLDQASFLAGLAQALKSLPAPAVVVHGGGKDVDALQERLGITPRKIEGIRYTDPDSLQAALMALCGSVQARLIAALLQGGIDALGLSGVDGGLLRARRLAHPIHDYGLVGEIIQVRTTLLLSLLEQGITPVLAPISLGPQGELLNVNADQVASAVAHALQAEQLDFVSNVPGVLDQGHLIPSLDPQTVADLKAKGVIEGGMLPKVDAALAALQAGVRRVRIVDLAGLPTEAGSTFLPQPKTPIQSGNKVTR